LNHLFKCVKIVSNIFFCKKLILVRENCEHHSLFSHDLIFLFTPTIA
jgi:hypothetical protein